jgi:hypothetical protein
MIKVIPNYSIIVPCHHCASRNQLADYRKSQCTECGRDVFHEGQTNEIKSKIWALNFTNWLLSPVAWLASKLDSIEVVKGVAFYEYRDGKFNVDIRRV